MTDISLIVSLVPDSKNCVPSPALSLLSDVAVEDMKTLLNCSPRTFQNLCLVCQVFVEHVSGGGVEAAYRRPVISRVFEGGPDSA